MSSCISQERPWSKNLEQSSHSGRVQHQGSARRTDMVLPRLGALRVTAGRLRVPDVTTGREQSPRLFLLLRRRTNDNHSIRLSSRRGSTLRRTRTRRRITLFSITARFQEGISGITGNLWRRKHTTQGGTSLTGGPILLGKTNSRRSILCHRGTIRPRLGHLRINDLNVLYRIQVSRHLQRSNRGSVRSPCEIQHSVLPVDSDAQLLFSSIRPESVDIWR